MKKTSSKHFARLLAGILGISMLCSFGALAAEETVPGRVTEPRVSFNTYDSEIYDLSYGGYDYEIYTTLYYTSSYFKSGVWMIADRTVPGNTMSLRAYLMDSSGYMLADSDWLTESGAMNFNFVETRQVGSSDDILYASGEFRLYSRNGSVALSGQAPEVCYDHGDISDVRSLRTMSKQDAPVNDQGLAYGSLLDYSLDELDLIAAVGTDGTPGYVLREQFSPKFFTLAAQQQYNESLLENNLIPLYDLGGKQIGEYALGAPGEEELDSVTQARVDALTLQASASDVPPTELHVPSALNETMQTGINARLEDGAYPTNSRGETYGGLFDRYVVGYQPDLLAVRGDAGRDGYVYARDWDRNQTGNALPVYDLDGNVIDQFTSAPGSF